MLPPGISMVRFDVYLMSLSELHLSHALFRLPVSRVQQGEIPGLTTARGMIACAGQSLEQPGRGYRTRSRDGRL